MAGIEAIWSAGNKVGKKMKELALQTGFDKRELQGFMKMSNTLASSNKRVDASAEGFGPQFTQSMVTKESLDRVNSLNSTSDTSFVDREIVTGSNRYTNEFSQDQVKGFIESFRKRQGEVYGRRAKPGISATRLG